METKRKKEKRKTEDKMNQVEGDLKILGIRQWKGMVHDRSKWRDITEEAQTVMKYLKLLNYEHSK